MFTASVMLIGGLLLLYKGADWLVGGSSSFARRLGVPPIIVGLTVVAFGTSAPELFVNLTASFAGKADIAISNVIGSNIANILLVLGVITIIRPLRLKHEIVTRQIPIALLAAGLTWVMASDHFLAGRPADRLDRIDGLVLIAFLLAFLYYLIAVAFKERGRDNIEVRPAWISAALVGAGLLALFLGGKLTVDGATGIARLLGLSDRFIGLTVIAIGTSLPELLTSVLAVLRRSDDIAVGNIIGSNILNVFWILGLSATVRPLPVAEASRSDIGVVVTATLLVFILSFSSRKRIMARWAGFTLIAGYVVYLAASIFSA
jgi:cation:H+ antiporter